jgi:hypothetical protein
MSISKEMLWQYTIIQNISGKIFMGKTKNDSEQYYLIAIEKTIF